MTKEQFVETLSGFIAPRLVEALVEQAEGKGYFEEASEQEVKQEIKINKNDLLTLFTTIEDLFEPFSDITPNFDVLYSRIQTFKETL